MGMGCCQTAIPRGMDYYNVGFDPRYSASHVSAFSPCSYAVLMEAAAFSFSTAYISTTRFNDTGAGRVPTVLDWAVRNGTMSCQAAKRNERGTYACLSSNSVCNCATTHKGTKATRISLMDAKILMNALTAHALQAAFATTR